MPDSDTPVQDNRLRDLSLLAGGLAHEIRNPLSTVNLNLQMLEEDLGETDCDDDGVRRARNRVEKIRREVNRLSDVLDDFLRFARMPQPERAPTDLNALIEDLVSFMQAEARSQKVSLRTNYTELPACSLDSDMMRQALINLIKNAEQAMPEGGDIMLCTEREGDQAVVTITDTGAGMDEGTLQRIFHPYFSTKREGNGLGLPTVRRIVEEHGGAISVMSEKGRGTRFTIRLPLQEAPVPEHADTP